jgi:hypothetical protein
MKTERPTAPIEQASVKKHKVRALTSKIAGDANTWNVDESRRRHKLTWIYLTGLIGLHLVQ